MSLVKMYFAAVKMLTVVMETAPTPGLKSLIKCFTAILQGADQVSVLLSLHQFFWPKCHKPLHFRSWLNTTTSHINHSFNPFPIDKFYRVYQTKMICR